MEEVEKSEHYKNCWQSTIKELNYLEKYTHYLEEKLMYALGPKNKEFADKTKADFRKILRKNFYKYSTTYEIHHDLLDCYKRINKANEEAE